MLAIFNIIKISEKTKKTINISLLFKEDFRNG